MATRGNVTRQDGGRFVDDPVFRPVVCPGTGAEHQWRLVAMDRWLMRFECEKCPARKVETAE